MGQGQSQAGGGGAATGHAAQSGNETKTSYYELLEVDRTATDDEYVTTSRFVILLVATSVH